MNGFLMLCFIAIVMLTRLEEKQQECSAVHWSDRERRRFGDISIQVTLQKEMGEYIYREMSLSHSEVSI